MKTIRRQYEIANDFLLRDLGFYFILAVSTFVLLTIFTTYLFQQNPEMVQTLLQTVVDQFKGIVVDGEISFVNLLINNLQASVLGILIGLIPFLFLPVLGILSNAAVLGIVFASAGATSVPLWKLIVFGILPHGVFELTAFFLCYAMGLSICWNLTKKIVGYRKRENMKSLIQNCMRAALLYVVPLLIVAALIETYLTSRIVAAFI